MEPGWEQPGNSCRQPRPVVTHGGGCSFNGAGLGTARKRYYLDAVDAVATSRRFNGAGLGTARKHANRPLRPTGSANTDCFNGAGLGTARKHLPFPGTSSARHRYTDALQWSRAGNSPETVVVQRIEHEPRRPLASMEPGWEQPGNRRARAGGDVRPRPTIASMEPGWEQPGNERPGCKRLSRRRARIRFNGAGLGTARKRRGRRARGVSSKFRAVLQWSRAGNSPETVEEVRRSRWPCPMGGFNGAGLGTARKRVAARLHPYREWAARSFNGAGLGTARKLSEHCPWLQHLNFASGCFNGAGLGTARKRSSSAATALCVLNAASMEPGWEQPGNAYSSVSNPTPTVGASMEPGWEQPGNRHRMPEQWGSHQDVQASMEPGWEQPGNAAYNGRADDHRTTPEDASMEPGWEQPGNRHAGMDSIARPPEGFNGAGLGTARKPGHELHSSQRLVDERGHASMEPGWEQPGNLTSSREDRPHTRPRFNGAGLGTARKRQ